MFSSGNRGQGRGGRGGGNARGINPFASGKGANANSGNTNPFANTGSSQNQLYTTQSQPTAVNPFGQNMNAQLRAQNTNPFASEQQMHTQPSHPFQHQQQPPSKPICKNFTRDGNCKFGSSCRFHHPQQGVQRQQSSVNQRIETERAVCKNFARDGSCKFGASCRFAHLQPTSSQTARSPWSQQPLQQQQQQPFFQQQAQWPHQETPFFQQKQQHQQPSLQFQSNQQSPQPFQNQFPREANSPLNSVDHAATLRVTPSVQELIETQESAQVRENRISIVNQVSGSKPAFEIEEGNDSDLPKSSISGYQVCNLASVGLSALCANLPLTGFDKHEVYADDVDYFISNPIPLIAPSRIK